MTTPPSREGYVEDILAVLPPLLGAMDRLAFVARHFHPPHFGELMAAIGAPHEPLKAGLGRLEAWPAELGDVRGALSAAATAVIESYEALAAADPEGPGDAYRALRGLPRAQAALYPLAGALAPVSRFFLPAEQRDDADLLARLAAGHGHPERGVIHAGGEPGARGAVSLYVPEDIDDGRPRPVVMALHGGSGNGAAFLWSWLPDARGAGAILAAPTSVGRTWALQGDDADSANLARILAFIRERWPVDETRILLTGMSDGGTFSYVSGLDAGSPFTHLAPVSAAFHPMLASFAEPERLAGLPVHIVHGALDWMFPIDMAREAQMSLERSGAAVRYLEIADLSHTYPREANATLLAWLSGG